MVKINRKILNKLLADSLCKVFIKNDNDFPQRFDVFGEELGDEVEILMNRRSENREAFRKLDDMIADSEQLLMRGFA